MEFFVSDFRLVRPEDHVVLDVSVTDLVHGHVDTPQGRKHFLTAPAGTTGRLKVRFGSQQILDYATPPAAPGGAAVARARQDRPVYSPATDVVVSIPPGSPVDLTVAGILEALAQHPLHAPGAPELPTVAPLRRATADAYELLAAREAKPSARREALLAERQADHRAQVAERLRRIAPERPAVPVVRPVAAPLAATPGTSTRIAFPRRFLLEVPAGSGPRLSHAAEPVDQETAAVELWTSRYAVATTDPDELPIEQPIPIGLGALGQAHPEPAGATELLLANSLTDENVTTFAGRASATQPATMTDLALSGLGGWVTLDGTWDNGANVPPDRLRHETRQGRDQYQKNVVVGRLAPFGNLCVLTATTVRRFENGDRRAAALRSIANIDILVPTITFDETRDEVIAGTNPPQHATRGNPWPWRSITVANPPSGLQGASTVAGFSSYQVGGADWAFEVTAVDRMGNTTLLRLPMLFRSGTAALTPSDANAWVAAYAATGLDLTGQPLAMTSVPQPAPLPPGPDGRSRRAGGGLPLAPTATTVLANNLKLTFAPDGRPEVTELLARIPSIDGGVRDLVGQADPAAKLVGEVALGYAQPYLDQAYTALNEAGQVFLQGLAQEGKQAVLDLGKSAAGGLAAAGLPIGALSASYGTLAGALGDLDSPEVKDSIAQLASGKVDLQVLATGVGSLLGLVPLGDIVDLDADLDLDDAQKVVGNTLNGVVTKTVLFDVPLFKRDAANHVIPYRKGFIELRPRADLDDPKLAITQTLTADAERKEVHSTTFCEIKGLELCVFYQSDPPADESPLVLVPFKTVSVAFRDTEKPEIDVKFSAVKFGGLLAYVGVLADIIDDLGLSDPPALEITPNGAKSSFSFQVPTIAFGVFALANVTFLTSIELDFVEQPAVLLIVEFSTFDNPFRVSVAILSGGGYLKVGAASDGLALLEGSLSFGASVAVNLGVAAGSVEAMGGICFRYDRDEPIAEIVAFLRVRGEVNVLGLISISVTLTITLTYDVDENSLIGEALLVVQVSVAFFSQEVTVPFTWEIAGGSSNSSQPGLTARAADGAAPTFADVMAPEQWDGELPWDTYCMAYA